MPGIIKINQAIQVIHDTMPDYTPPAIQETETMIGDSIWVATIAVTTSWAQVTVDANLGTPGWARFTNHGANVQHVGKWTGATGVEFLRLEPGATQQIKLAVGATEIAVIDLTAASEMTIQLLEE